MRLEFLLGSSLRQELPEKEPLLNGVFQGLACFEPRHFRGRNLNLGTSLRVTTGTSSTLFYRESTKTDQSYLITLLQAPVMELVIASRARPAAALEISEDSAIASISSDLFTLNPFDFRLKML